MLQRHQPAARHFLRHLARSDAAPADDLAEETFVQAWRSLARFHGGSAFTTCLLCIAHNHWRNAPLRTRPHAKLDESSANAPVIPAATA